MKYHVIVTGSRPEKGSNNRYLPMPQENTDFIANVLAKVATNDYAALYHGMAAGVDTVVDNYAHANGIRVKQFPAYWFDPTKEGNVNKAAGIFRNEAMIRQASDDVHNDNDRTVIVLGFYSTPTLDDSKGTKHAIEYATKKGLTTRTFQLPILNGSTPEVKVQTGTSNTVMPDPFGA